MGLSRAVSQPVILLLLLTACVAVSSCGRASRDDPSVANATGGASTLGSRGAESDPSEGGANAAASAGAPDAAVAIDAANCGKRPLAECTGVESRYGSDSGFEDTPALVECAMFNSHDGCGKLVFAFDAEGCAISVAPDRSGWEHSEHLSALRACLTAAFSRARYDCLASGTLSFDESCLIR